MPLLKTGAVEEMLAEDCEKAGCIVHALEADGTCWQFDEGVCWWWEGFEVWWVRGGREGVVGGEFGEGGCGCLEGYAFDEEDVAGFWLLGVSLCEWIGGEGKNVPPFQ